MHVCIMQVELLLTFEEYCNEEGVFENQAENGKAFADIFEPVSAVDECLCV